MSFSRAIRMTVSLVLPALVAWVGGRAWNDFWRARLVMQDYEPPPPGMVLVPAGEFWMGSRAADAEPDEKPLRKVFVSAFYIDQFEVTNRRYTEFNPAHRFPAGEEELPVTFVMKRDAEAFCRWAGRRLPASAEWEKAARGTDARTYPWGNLFTAGHANINRRISAGSTDASACDLAFTSPKGKLLVGSFPQGVSPYGCHDMAGNVWEWVSDVWQDKNLLGLHAYGDARGILRGGAYNYSRRQARTSYQGFEALGTTCHDVGFRCAMDAVAKSTQPRERSHF